MHVHIHACMPIQTSIYTFQRMWTPQTTTHYVWEAEQGVRDE